jgi:hypothetical protein
MSGISSIGAAGKEDNKLNAEGGAVCDRAALGV